MLQPNFLAKTGWWLIKTNTKNNFWRFGPSGCWRMTQMRITLKILPQHEKVLWLETSYLEFSWSSLQKLYFRTAEKEFWHKFLAFLFNANSNRRQIFYDGSLQRSFRYKILMFLRLMVEISSISTAQNQCDCCQKNKNCGSFLPLQPINFIYQQERRQRVEKKTPVAVDRFWTADWCFKSSR